MGLFGRRKKPSEAEGDSMLTADRQDGYMATLMMLQIEKSVTPPEGSAELRMTALDEKKTIEGILLRPGGWLAYGPVLKKVADEARTKAREDFERNWKDFR